MSQNIFIDIVPYFFKKTNIAKSNRKFSYCVSKKNSYNRKE